MANQFDDRLTMMRAEHVPEVVSIHSQVLGNTFNARIGIGYLEALYHNVVECPLGVGFVAFHNNKIAGFVTGTTNLPYLQWHLARRLSMRTRLTLLRQLVRPSNLIRFGATWLVNQPVRHSGRVADAYLLTLGVRAELHGKGFGRLLVLGLINEFRRCGVSQLALNTVASDVTSRRFYETLGFHLVSIRVGNAIYFYDIVTPATIE